MAEPTNNFDHLWNDLTFEDRKKLTPYMLELQKLHIFQCKQKAIAAHKKHMKELDNWLARLDSELNT